MVAIVLFIVLWYISGVASFIYWWTKSHDLTATDMVFALFVGLIGPIAFIMGAQIHGNGFVLIKKQKKNKS